MKKLISLSVLIGLGGFMTACATTSSPSGPLTGDALQCAVMVDVAHQIEADNVSPKVGQSVDCTDTFTKAGLPMHSVAIAPNDANWGHVWVFGQAEFTGTDDATVALDYTCLRLCGNGEKLTLHRESGQWKIIERKTTWIS